MENHNFQWENPLFLWPFSIAFSTFTRTFRWIFFGLGPRHRCVSAARSPGRCRWRWEARPTPPGAAGIVGENATGWKRMAGYPLVNVYIAMENHHFSWVNPL